MPRTGHSTESEMEEEYFQISACKMSAIYIFTNIKAPEPLF